MPADQALVIGVDTYLSKDFERLPSCKKDAQDLAGLLASLHYEVVEKGPLIGSELDNEYGWIKIRDAIFDFFEDAKPSQKLLFYFSGHGLHGHNEVFLATPQVDPRKPEKRGFALSELTRFMASSKSKNIVGIIDACYSGSVNLPSGMQTKSANEIGQDCAKQALATYDRIWKNTPKARGIFLLLSSQAYGASYAAENSNSLYTKYLLEGLRGVKPSVIDGRILPSSGSIEFDGDVTPKSLHDYIYDKVANETDQVPELKSDQSSNLAIASYPNLAFQNPAQERKPVDLSKWVTIHDQGSGGNSVAFAAVTAMETSLALRDIRLPLSATYVYEKAKMHDESKEETTLIATVAYVIRQFGVPPESTWPYEPHVRTLPKGTNWKELDSKASEVTARVYFLTSFDDILVHLSKGRPIVAGVPVYESFIDAVRGQIPLPNISGSESLLGGHCIVIVGYDPGSSSYRFANSWGTNWGDNGFGSMSENVARTYLEFIDETFAVEV